jgi:hypothetical protein
LDTGQYLSIVECGLKASRFGFFNPHSAFHNLQSAGPPSKSQAVLTRALGINLHSIASRHSFVNRPWLSQLPPARAWQVELNKQSALAEPKDIWAKAKRNAFS